MALVVSGLSGSPTPQAWESTMLVESSARSSGGTGMVTLLGVTLARVHDGTLTLPQALALLTHKPAGLLKSDAGTLAKGATADLCLFAPEQSWLVEAGKLPGRAQNTPFDRRALEGKVLGTWKAGNRVFEATPA